MFSIYQLYYKKEDSEILLFSTQNGNLIDSVLKLDSNFFYKTTTVVNDANEFDVCFPLLEFNDSEEGLLLNKIRSVLPVPNSDIPDFISDLTDTIEGSFSIDLETGEVMEICEFGLIPDNVLAEFVEAEQELRFKT